MSDAEVDIYMQNFDRMAVDLTVLEEEHRKGEKIPKQEFGQRLAQYSNVQKMLIKYNKMVLDQLRHMNNIFAAPEPTDAQN